MHFDSNYARQSSIQVKTRPITCFVRRKSAGEKAPRRTRFSGKKKTIYTQRKLKVNYYLYARTNDAKGNDFKQ